MEQFFQDNLTYTGATAGTDDPNSSIYFVFSTKDDGGTDTRKATSYTLFARGKGPMAGFTYTIDQANVKTSTVTGFSGWSGSTTCWVTRAGGVC